MESKSGYKYFAVSERDKRWGLYVLNCGESIFAKNEEFPAKDHPRHHYFQWQYGRVLSEFQMFYLLDGSGIFESKQTGERPLNAGDFVLLFPNAWHRYRPDTASSWHTHWVGFDGLFARHLESQQFFSRIAPIIRIGYQEHIVRSFAEIQSLGNDEHAGYQQAMAGLMMKILADVSAFQHRGQFQHSNQEELIHRARIKLIGSIDQAIIMQEVARELGLGYSFFRRLFKQYTGLAPGQYLIQLRLEKAKELLCDPERPIKQIAVEVGFESVYYFSRLLKEKTGVSPGFYRKRALGVLERQAKNKDRKTRVF
jgi:AraC-like DNA-binding protein